MRVTSKGQVTIPIGIRQKLGIQPNTEVRFVIRNGIVVLEKAASRGSMKRPSRGETIVARLRQAALRSSRSSMSTDELMALTRDD
jgi:AbrB family looped-hinge helix DNA binding protein